MASHHQQPPSPGGMHLHHGPQGGHPQANGHMPMQAHHKITPAHLASLNESVWLMIGKIFPSEVPSAGRAAYTSSTGSTTELMGDLEGALYAYEQAMRHNPQSISAMNAISCILRTKEDFRRAVEYLQGILRLDGNNGEVWGSLGKSNWTNDLWDTLTNGLQAIATS